MWLQNVLDFLNENSGAFSLLFSLAVAIATVIYAYLTSKLVSETKTMRKAQTEPEVAVTIQPKEWSVIFIDMVIQNIGLGPAYDVSFKVSPDFEYEPTKPFSGLGFMRNGLKYLAPNQRLQFYLGKMVDLRKNIGDGFEVEVTYRNSLGNIRDHSYFIDFSEIIDLAHLGRPPLHKMADSIDKIEKSVHHLTSGFYRMKVNVYTTADLEEERNQALGRGRPPERDEGE